MDKREIGYSDIFRFLNVIKGGTYKVSVMLYIFVRSCLQLLQLFQEIDILNELIEAYRGNDDVRMSAEEKRIFTSDTKREAIKALLTNGQITRFVFEGVEFISDDDHSSTGSR